MMERLNFIIILLPMYIWFSKKKKKHFGHKLNFNLIKEVLIIYKNAQYSRSQNTLLKI